MPYCGDGRSHFLEFNVQGRASGEDDVALAKPGNVTMEALVAARLEPTPTPETEAIRANLDGTGTSSTRASATPAPSRSNWW